MRPSRRARRLVVALAVLLIALPVAGTQPAAAHAGLLRTSPAEDEVVDAAPSTVSATFGGPLLDVGSALVVRAADGTVVSEPVAQVTGASIEVALLPAVPPGEYQASYRIVSADGHALTGTWGFTIAGTPPSVQPSSPGATSAPSAASPAQGPPLALVLAIVLAGIVATVIVVMRRRR